MKRPKRALTQRKNNTASRFILLVVLVFIVGCAHSGERHTSPDTSDKAPVTDVPNLDTSEDAFFEDDAPFNPGHLEKKELLPDPLYYFNKAMFHFNDKLYFWLLKPVAKGYKAATPNFFRVGVKNFFSNLGMPLRFTSCVLQGKVKGAGSEMGRFIVNSILGFGGVIEVAEPCFHLKQADEDLGQALGHYGMKGGFYLYLPFFGPTTARDAIGTSGASWLSPFRYIDDRDVSRSLFGLSTLNSLSFSIGNYEAVKSISLDPYTMIRDFYIEQRKKKIRE